uniref:hypothetical protein n=1 Tax=Mesorhizobium sp. WSM4875 TaxID=3038539 RepID=UPI0024171BE9|nr:hypothetical protein [Mesorhizobium sp. WSM4875]WIE94769.1 hypothetical protein P9270_030020 [Mesorhizobium sp. WSM4875]
MKKTALVSDRSEALAFISANLKQLHLVAASHRLHLLGYLLGMAYMESCDMVRREGAHDQSKVANNGKVRAFD